MYDDEIKRFLPSARKDLIAAAIGRPLLEIERFLGRDIQQVVARGLAPTDFFSRNTGATQLHFSGGLIHSLVVYPEQLSIVTLPDLIVGDDIEPSHKLSEETNVLPFIKSCLGRICEDVRIYTYAEGFESEEAREAGISYLFAGHGELIYCIYLHGDDDSAYLLPGTQVPHERVERCYSIASGGWVPA